MSYLREVENQRREMKARTIREKLRNWERRGRKHVKKPAAPELDKYMTIRDGKQYRCAYCWEYLKVPDGILQRLKRLLTTKRPRHSDLTCPRTLKEVATKTD